MDPTGRACSAWLPSYREAFRRSLEAARADGFGLVEADAIAGEMRPRDLSGSARRHLVRHFRDVGLHLHGLAAEFDGPGLADPSRADARLAELADVAALSRDLGVSRVHTRVPSAASPLGVQLLREVAALAERNGVRVVVHGSPEELASQVRAIACDRLTVGLDSSLADPVGSANHCHGILGGVFLRDVQRREGGSIQVPYGEGEADFAQLLAELDRSGYRDPLTLRWDGPGGAEGLRLGLEYFRSRFGVGR